MNPHCDGLPEWALGGVILPTRDCPFCSSNKISPKSKRVHKNLLSQNIFLDGETIFCDFSGGMNLENKKTKSINENGNKENKNVDKFEEYILQTQSNVKVGNAK